MYTGYRARRFEDGVMVWEFFSEHPGTPDQRATDTVRIPLPGSTKNISREDAISAIEELTELCWQQGRASAHAEHATDTQALKDERERYHKLWAKAATLDTHLLNVRKLMVDAWSNQRMIAPEELRELVISQAKEDT